MSARIIDLGTRKAVRLIAMHTAQRDGLSNRMAKQAAKYCTHLMANGASAGRAIAIAARFTRARRCLRPWDLPDGAA